MSRPTPQPKSSARPRATGAEPVGDREDVRDLRLAGCEEALDVPRAALLVRRGQHRPERIDLGEPLPVLLVPLEAHPPTIH